MDKTAFCQWVQRQERKYEWREGEVVMMRNASRANGLIVTNLVLAFGGRLDLSKWNAMAVDFGVEVEEATRYPDIIAEPRQADDLKGRRSDLPVLIIEVLSPSSGAGDFVEKLAEYQTIPSIEAYIVASQDCRSAGCGIAMRRVAFQHDRAKYLGVTPRSNCLPDP